MQFGPDGTTVVNQPLFDAREKLAKAGSTKVTVPVDMKAENAYASGAGTAAIKRDNTQHELAVAAPTHIAKLDETLKELKSGKAITGIGAELMKDFERIRAQVTNDKAAGKNVSDTEYLDSLLGSDVFPLIQQLGIGARGMDTPAEREFLRAVMTGTITLNKDTLIRMTESRRRTAQKTLDNWNKRVESGEVDDYFKYSKLPKSKIEYTPQVTVPTTPSGTPASQQLSPAEQAELDQLRKRFKK
jgi:hypothetical protein